MADNDTRINTPPLTDPSANAIMFNDATVKYMESLIEAVKATMDRQFAFIEQLTKSETERINALRAIDVKAVEEANARAIKQAEILASQVSSNAETLRLSVLKTSETIAIQLKQITDELTKRLAALESVRYESQGKESAGGNVLTRITDLESNKVKVQAVAEGKALTWNQLKSMLTVFGVIITIMLGLIALFAFFK